MGSKTEKLVDKTILNTPKPMATSTVIRKPTRLSNAPSLIQESSTSDEYANYQLQEQRSLAEKSLQRANNIVIGIPSQYFRGNGTNPTRFSNLSDSTVNESDLLRAPADTSTPKSSVGRTSFSNSLAQLSHKIRNSDISIVHSLAEFHKETKTVNKTQLESIIFTPAEEAASMLLADELSWRRQNEIPVNDSRLSEINPAQTSIGEFFRQKSDTLSIFDSTSPKKTHRPVPLIELSEINNTDNEIQLEQKKNKSLSISAIQKCLQSENTPRKATNLLLKQSDEPDITSYLLEKKMEKMSLGNLSYESDQSDEILKCFDKENVDTLNTSNKNRHSTVRSVGSPTSRSSSRALTSLPDGKLPIESTASELVWGCVKIDRCVTQEFSIRNKSSKRLGIQMSLSGHDYKIRKDNRSDSDLMSSTKVILHPYESKLINVSFIPSRIGACVDMLSFSPIDYGMQQTKRQSVWLFGYGGYDKVEFTDLTRDITGKYLMSLGKLDNKGELTRTFTIENRGVLPSFVYISYNSKIYSQVTIEPNFFILSNEIKHVTVRNVFTPQSSKIFQKSLNSTSVLDLGALNIVTGTEANRGRLRRLCRKMTEAGSSVDALSNVLKQTVSGELIPVDIRKFKESIGSFSSILQLFNRYEVVLTVEVDPDQTILMQYPDESGMYHTLSETTCMSVLENTVAPTLSRLEPSTVILTPPSKTKDFLFLNSEANRPLQYQVQCEPQGLEVNPKRGVLNPSQEIKIFLNYPQVLPNVDCFKVSLTVGNEICECTVKIKLEL